MNGETSSKWCSLLPVVPPNSAFNSGLEDFLLVHGSDLSDKTCANAIDRPEMWGGMPIMSEPGNRVRVDPQELFMNQLASLCVRSQLQHCSRQKCVEKRDSLDKYAPRCEWLRFREWWLALVACQISFSPEQKLTRAYTPPQSTYPSSAGAGF